MKGRVESRRSILGEAWGLKYTPLLTILNPIKSDLYYISVTAGMLVIRKKQMEALDRQSEKLFLDRMVDHLSEIFPDKCEELGSRAQIRELARQDLDRARGYGIDTEQDVALYVDITFGIGPDFPDGEDMHWARSILENDGLSGPAKMALILQRLEKQFAALEDKEGVGD